MTEYMDLLIDPSENTARVELFGGKFWVEIKKELTIGEATKLQNAGLKYLSPGEDDDGNMPAPGQASARNVRVSLDMAKPRIMRVLMHVIDWNLCDRRGKTLPITLSTLAQMRQPVFEALESAIDAHATVTVETDDSGKKSESTPSEVA
jgi:hypothetical protein